MTRSAPLMAGRRGLIMGVANDRSLAWGIASACAAQGAELAFTYQGDAMAKRVKPLAESVGASLIMPCDVADDDSIEATFTQISETWGRLDFLLHAIAHSDKSELSGLYLHTSRDNFMKSLEISCYSFTALAQRAEPLMGPGGAMLTLTYYGAERVIPHYNVMGVAKAALEASVRYLASDLGGRGIRVNGLSAGPVRTLAASGIGDFRHILRWNELNSPLKRNVTIQDIGRAGMYLLSELSSGVTGEIHHVDSGYHTVGMLAVDNVDATAAYLQALVSKPT